MSRESIKKAAEELRDALTRFIGELECEEGKEPEPAAPYHEPPTPPEPAAPKKIQAGRTRVDYKYKGKKIENGLVLMGDENSQFLRITREPGRPVMVPRNEITNIRTP